MAYTKRIPSYRYDLSFIVTRTNCIKYKLFTLFRSCIGEKDINWSCQISQYDWYDDRLIQFAFHDEASLAMGKLILSEYLVTIEPVQYIRLFRKPRIK